MRIALFAFVTILSLAPTAFAKTSIRVPLVLSNPDGSKTYYVDEVATELKKAGVTLPEYLEVTNSNDAYEIWGLSDQVDNANVQVDGETLALETANTLGTYSNGKDRFVCYTSDQKNADKAAAEAFAIVGDMTDSVLSDQYSIWGYRFWNTDFTTDGSTDEEELQRMKDEFGTEVLNKGDIQIIATTSDSGDDPFSDVLIPCK